jgi:hypothetical protein
VGRSVVVCLLLALAIPAWAAPWHTTEAVTLRKKPGEKEDAVAQLPANTPVVVLAEEGRWLKVRAGTAVGYLARTTVVDAAPPTGGGSGAWSAKPHDTWIARTNGAAPAGETPRDEPTEYTRPPAAVREIRVELGLGYRALGMDFSSNAAGGLTNYLLDADAITAVVGVDAVFRRARMVYGVDGRFAFSDASPGIDYPGPTGPSGKIPFHTVETDAGARGGIRVQDAIDIALRAGLHYDAWLASNVDNAGMLPRERLLGVTAGVRIDAAPAHSRFSIAARFDVLALGSRAQTPGLEDGTSSSAHAVWGGATFSYALGPRYALGLGYDFERAWTHWSGASQREPGVTSAQRVDSAQLVHLGVSRSL